MKFSDLEPGMEVIFDRKSIDFERLARLNNWNPKKLFLNYKNPIQYYESRYKKYENVPLKVLSNEYNPYTREGFIEFLKPDGNTDVITNDYFDPTNENSFKLSLFQKARDVRNTRLMAARTGLPHGPESIIASQLSGLPGNAAEQNDSFRKKVDSSYVSPDGRQRMSGGKSRRGRKNRRRTRKH